MGGGGVANAPQSCTADFFQSAICCLTNNHYLTACPSTMIELTKDQELIYNYHKQLNQWHLDCLGLKTAFHLSPGLTQTYSHHVVK